VGLDVVHRAPAALGRLDTHVVGLTGLGPAEEHIDGLVVNVRGTVRRRDSDRRVGDANGVVHRTLVCDKGHVQGRCGAGPVGHLQVVVDPAPGADLATNGVPAHQVRRHVLAQELEARGRGPAVHRDVE
jgi:hypothetical protein